MVNFADVIPFYWAIPIGLLLLAVAMIVAWVRRALKRLRGLTGGITDKLRIYFEGDAKEREAEGYYWYFGEAINYVLLALVIYVVIIIFSYLLTSPPNTSIFDAVLGNFTIPVVTLIIMHYVVKSIPYLVKSLGGDNVL